MTVVQPGKSLLTSTAIRVQPGNTLKSNRLRPNYFFLRTVIAAKRALKEENEVLEPSSCASHNDIIVFSAYFCPCTDKVDGLGKRLNE